MKIVCLLCLMTLSSHVFAATTEAHELLRESKNPFCTGTSSVKSRAHINLSDYTQALQKAGLVNESTTSDELRKILNSQPARQILLKLFAASAGLEDGLLNV